MKWVQILEISMPFHLHLNPLLGLRNSTMLRNSVIIQLPPSLQKFLLFLYNWFERPALTSRHLNIIPKFTLWLSLSFSNLKCSYMTCSLQNRWISRTERETRYTSAERDHKHEVRHEKNPPVVTPLFMLYRPLEMIGMKEWEFIDVTKCLK